MSLPSLLRDYTKYLDIEKDPTKDRLDLSHIRFVAPASILPTVFFARSNSITKYILPDNDARFHFKKILRISDSNSNLLPLLDLDLHENNEKREEALNNLENEIRNLIFPSGNISYSSYGGTETFPYIIREIIRNINQHSNASKVYSYSQIYPNTDFIDVGILDNGDTIPGKYEESRDEFYNENGINPYEVENDCEAIFRSLNGISTKDDFKRASSIRFARSVKDILESGKISLGINSSVRLITEGLDGSFLIVSRGGICHLTKRRKHFRTNEDSFNGTFVCIRFKRTFLTAEKYEEIAYKYNKIDDEFGNFELIS